MSDKEKIGPFRNQDGEVSIKKTLGTLGALIFFGICVVSVIKDPTTIESILPSLGWFSGGLLGLNLVMGVADKLSNMGGKP